MNTIKISFILTFILLIKSLFSFIPTQQKNQGIFNTENFKSKIKALRSNKQNIFIYAGIGALGAYGLYKYLKKNNNSKKTEELKLFITKYTEKTEEKVNIINKILKNIELIINTLIHNIRPSNSIIKDIENIKSKIKTILTIKIILTMNTLKYNIRANDNIIKNIKEIESEEKKKYKKEELENYFKKIKLYSKKIEEVYQKSKTNFNSLIDTLTYVKQNKQIQKVQKVITDIEKIIETNKKLLISKNIEIVLPELKYQINRSEILEKRVIHKKMIESIIENIKKEIKPLLEKDNKENSQKINFILKKLEKILEAIEKLNDKNDEVTFDNLFKEIVLNYDFNKLEDDTSKIGVLNKAKALLFKDRDLDFNQIINILTEELQEKKKICKDKEEESLKLKKDERKQEEISQEVYGLKEEIIFIDKNIKIIEDNLKKNTEVIYRSKKLTKKMVNTSKALNNVSRILDLLNQKIKLKNNTPDKKKKEELMEKVFNKEEKMDQNKKVNYDLNETSQLRTNPQKSNL